MDEHEERLRDEPGRGKEGIGDSVDSSTAAGEVACGGGRAAWREVKGASRGGAFDGGGFVRGAWSQWKKKLGQRGISRGGSAPTREKTGAVARRHGVARKGRRQRGLEWG